MTPENRAGEVFYDFHRPLFESLLLNASSDEQRWAHRVKSFENHGLLDFQTASNLKPKPVFDQFVEDENGERIYAFRESQLDEPKWKRGLVRKLKAPRPGKWTRHRLQLHRDRVADSKYREDISKVLSYKWVGNFEPQDMDILYLKLMDVAALEYFLDTFRLNDIGSTKINAYLMRRLAEELLDKNEKFQALMASMKAEIAPVREKAYAEIRQIVENSRIQSTDAFEAISQESNERFEAAIAEIRARAAANALRDAEYMAKNPSRSDEDPQVAFRRAVDQSIARKNAARKRLARMRRRHPGGFLFWLATRAAMVAAPIALAYFMEFGESGVTLVEILSGWFAGA